MVSVLGYESLTEMRNLLYGCEAVTTLDSDELKGTFVRNDEFVANSLESGKLHGLFIDTSSQGAWIEDSTELVEQMQFLKLIDRSTRLFNVIAITRNDGNEDLYYSKISFSFKMLVDGKIILKMEPSYIPIVHYIYGLDDHPWVFREILILECFFLLVLCLFTIREIRQDYKQIILFFTILSIRSTAKIGDLLSMAGESEHSENNDSNNHAATSNDPSGDDDNDNHDHDGNIENNGNKNVRSNLEIGEIDSEVDEAEAARGQGQGSTDICNSNNDTLERNNKIEIFSATSVGNMTLIPDDSNWYNILDWSTIIVGYILV